MNPDDAMIEMYQRGATMRTAAATFGHGAPYLCKLLKRREIVARPAGFRCGVARSRRRPFLRDGVCVVPLQDGTEAITDADMLDAVRSSTFYRTSSGYVIRTSGRARAKVCLHRLVCLSDSETVDHINGDKLDCRRVNLRPASAAENVRNAAKRRGSRTRFKGVTALRTGRFAARLTLAGVTQHLGTYATEEDAARAYNRAAREHFGEFARLNPEAVI